ncbi:MAG TPA: multicopper oxidase domain-containing protein [Thermoanaerobaculia bacterium]|nr:multicopper oxidase domain-containing protein [Thermoanaerobaculia bacterium]
MSRRISFLIAFLLSAPFLVAQVVPGCRFDPIDVTKYGYQPFQNPPEVRAADHVLQTTLAVMYTDPARVSVGGCPVKLRSYNGQLVGPTLRIRPGDIMDILLDNRLPVESPDEVASQIRQEAENAFIETRPHSFNTTNLHTHGLHVSPAANSDNVLLAIAPQTKFPYEIRVPANHPPGTFWYHAHAHGSTAVQVGSGMAGALIIGDDEAKIPAALREANKHEKVMVIQTTLYDAQGEVKDITAFFPGGANDPNCAAQKPSCTWGGSNRRVTINGQIVPIITMRPGEVQRWRMIDSGFRESFNLALEGHVLHEIALDGLYLGRIDDWDGTNVNRTVELQPGYRSDVLVKASMKPGDYKLIDAPVSGVRVPAEPCPAQDAAQQTTSVTRAVPRTLAATTAPPVTIAGALRTSLLGVEETQNVIAIVRVAGDPLDMKLPTSAEMAALAPFPGVNLEAQADGVQQATFKIGSGDDPNEPRNSFQINFRAFNPTHVRNVRLNHTDVWTLTTVGDPPCVPRRPAESKTNPSIPPLPHVFHIHVNPFQTTRLDPSGKPEVVWKDTLLVPPAAQLRLYTQYLDYIGQFVMHCHILDHEDLGMMEIVEVVPDAPASAMPAHGGH